MWNRSVDIAGSGSEEQERESDRKKKLSMEKCINFIEKYMLVLEKQNCISKIYILYMHKIQEKLTVEKTEVVKSNIDPLKIVQEEIISLFIFF